MIILMKHLSLSPSLGHFDPPSLSLSPSCTARFSLPLSLVRPRGTATGGRVYIPTHTHTQSRRRAQQQQRRAVLNIARARARHRRCSKYNAEHLSPRLQSAPRKRARRFSSILLYILSRHCYFLTLPEVQAFAIISTYRCARVYSRCVRCEITTIRTRSVQRVHARDKKTAVRLIRFGEARKMSQ